MSTEKAKLNQLDRILISYVVITALVIVGGLKLTGERQSREYGKAVKMMDEEGIRIAGDRSRTIEIAALRR